MFIVMSQQMSELVSNQRLDIYYPASRILHIGKPTKLYRQVKMEPYKDLKIVLNLRDKYINPIALFP